MKKTKCFTCGGDYDTRYIDTPCPECGKMYGVVALEEKKVDKEFITQAESLNIPNEYIGVKWSKDLLLKEKSKEASNRNFIRFTDQLEKVVRLFEVGRIPAKSALVIAPSGYSKVTWAYTCMQLALEHGFTVAPILDTIELKRLLILASENPRYKLYGTVDYDKYIMSDICFVTVTKTDYCMDAWRVILEIIDRRSRKGLPTFIISRFDLETLSKRDYDGHFKSFVDYNGNQNSLKYPVIIQYETGF